MIVLAAGAHPDDIEFMMGGTFIKLKEKGLELHYLNIANGSCGTQEYSREEIIKIRREESINAAKIAGAIYHDSLVDDLEIFYTQDLIRKVAAIVRDVKPDIILMQSLEDYMEDHMNAARVLVTAAFVRGMPNYATNPPLPPINKDVALYHSLPHGLKTQMRETVYPDFYINVEDVLEKKKEMLSQHKSQKDWLDKSQGMGSYVKTMVDMTEEMGRMSKKFKYAEGWRLHNYLGYSSKEINPLCEILEEDCLIVK